MHLTCGLIKVYLLCSKSQIQASAYPHQRQYHYRHLLCLAMSDSYRLSWIFLLLVLVLQVLQTTDEVILPSRLIIDAMGNFSPVLKQVQFTVHAFGFYIIDEGNTLLLQYSKGIEQVNTLK